MENFGIFYDHMVYYVAVCSLWQFGICRGHLLYYPYCGSFNQWQPCNGYLLDIFSNKVFFCFKKLRLSRLFLASRDRKLKP
jgi:hypothetical protein